MTTKLIEDKYIKQTNFSAIGKEGQILLSKSKIVVIGCGALGTVIINSLARAGAGFLRIVDRDFVEMSNLHRQILFDEEDVHNHMPKAEAAAQKLRKVNSSIEIEAIIKDVNSITIENLVDGMDIIVDGTDNFKTRYLINDAAFSKNIPWIYGAAIGSTGIVKSFIPGKGPCLRCFMDVPPPTGSIATCDTAGVINTITGIVGLYEANEAIKYVTGNMDLMETRMIYLDIWDNTYETIELNQKIDCPCCVKKEYIYLQDKVPEGVHICGSNSVQLNVQNTTLKLKSLYERLKGANMDVTLTPFLLNLKADGYEMKVFDDGRTIVKNAKTLEEAKVVYSKYIGY